MAVQVCYIHIPGAICKVLESSKRDNIVNHLTNRTLLLQSQHGLLSCLTDLLQFLKDVRRQAYGCDLS